MHGAVSDGVAAIEAAAAESFCSRALGKGIDLKNTKACVVGGGGGSRRPSLRLGSPE